MNVDMLERTLSGHAATWPFTEKAAGVGASLRNQYKERIASNPSNCIDLYDNDKMVYLTHIYSSYCTYMLAPLT